MVPKWTVGTEGLIAVELDGEQQDEQKKNFLPALSNYID
jgi:hypothetical protein